MRLEMVHRVLDAIEEYIYVGELLPDDGYDLLYQGPCRANFLALDADAAADATWSEYVHPEDRDLFEHVHRDARVTGVLDAQYRLIDADGETRWVRDRGRVRRAHWRRGRRCRRRARSRHRRVGSRERF